MAPVQILVLATLLFSVYLGWTLSRGHAGRIRLYIIAGVIALSLYGAALAQVFQSTGLVEALYVVALGLSLGMLPAGPWLWEEQIRRDLEATRLYTRFVLRDLASWKAWLKLVDRVGAARASLAYLALFVLAIVGVIATLLLRGPDTDRAFALAPLSAPGLFCILSAIWIYRTARRLVPGA